jgi:hypothetical protein
MSQQQQKTQRAKPLKVERGIPPPARYNPRDGLWGLLSKMAVGDSLLVPFDGQWKASYIITIPSKVTKVFAPKRYAGAAEGGGYRVWRVA